LVAELPESIERFKEFSPHRIWKNTSPCFARLGARSSQCIGLVDRASALNSDPSWTSPNAEGAAPSLDRYRANAAP
jgi:hypothetical protein